VSVPYTYGLLAIYKLKKKFQRHLRRDYLQQSRNKEYVKKVGLKLIDLRLFFFGCFVGVLGKKL